MRLLKFFRRTEELSSETEQFSSEPCMVPACTRPGTWNTITNTFCDTHVEERSEWE